MSSETFAPTPRTALKRLPKRAVFDRDRVYEILDEAFICHLGFSVDGHPFVIPTGYGRIGDELFIHGSAASRTLRTLAGQVEVCVTVTLIDGLVLARSAFHHSMNYRSVMIFGMASVVEDQDAKVRALRAFSDHVMPNRWSDVREPDESELKKTLVLRLPLNEVSAKVRMGPPLDDEADYALPTWAGEVPFRMVAQNPIPDPRSPATTELPEYISRYVEAKRDDYRLQIRRANLNDVSGVSDLLEAAFIEYRQLYTPEGYAATAITSDEVAARISEGPMWVALLDDKIVGTVAAITKDDSLYIRGMGIQPAARGKRIGEKLMKHVEAFAVEQGHSQLTLSTTPFLDRAIRLYEKLGYERVGDEPLDLFGTPLFSMSKPVATTTVRG